MKSSSGGTDGRHVMPVSSDDVARVVSRAFSQRTWRIRLTTGQRWAILHPPARPGTAR